MSKPYFDEKLVSMVFEEGDQVLLTKPYRWATFVMWFDKDKRDQLIIVNDPLDEVELIDLANIFGWRRRRDNEPFPAEKEELE